ncbi:MAG: hypothetical protein WDW36_001164 [Sanguina aurantia]
MASRHIKRLLERQLQNKSESKLGEEDDASEEDEDEQPSSAKPFNPFDLLSDDEGPAPASEEEEEEPVTVAPPAISTAAKNKKGGKAAGKGKKGKGTGTARNADTDPDHVGAEEEDIDALVQRLNLTTVGTVAAQAAEHAPASLAGPSHLLAVDLKNLRGDDELRRIFGAEVISAVDREDVAEAADRRRRGAATRGTAQQQQRRRPMKKALLVAVKDSWPPLEVGGLSMEFVGMVEGRQMFKYVWSSSYHGTQRVFEELQATFDPNQIAGLLQQRPLAASSLSVINAAPGRFVALLGTTVSNQGSIDAPQGSVALGAGSAVTLSFSGNSLVKTQVDQSMLNSLAENGSLIRADGGRVLMSAGANDALLSSVVNAVVIMRAPHTGGGFIETSAAHVKIADGAKVTTAAATGKSGTWLIDPADFNIGASATGTVAGGTPSGDMSGATLSAALASGQVTILSSQGSTTSGNGNVNVNDAVNWSANQLTLNAQNNINVNANLTATGAASLALQYGQSTPAGSGSNVVTTGGKINLASPSADRLHRLHRRGRADVDLASAAFTPIGTFTSTFDGLGHTISNLTITGGASTGSSADVSGATIQNQQLRLGMNVGGDAGALRAGGTPTAARSAASRAVWQPTRATSATALATGGDGSDAASRAATDRQRLVVQRSCAICATAVAISKARCDCIGDVPGRRAYGTAAAWWAAVQALATSCTALPQAM